MIKPNQIGGPLGGEGKLVKMEKTALSPYNESKGKKKEQGNHRGSEADIKTMGGE